LFCNGAEVSRTTYSALFTAIGTAWGEGDGSTTFNLPDLRYKFLRGYGPTNEKTGTGSASSNNATFTNHGFSIGQRIRKTSGTLSGLSNNVDYYVIVVDSNTIAFATTRANAFSNTKIAISGSNSAVISIWEDTDASDRQVNRAGGNSGANVGSVQADQFQSHEHLVNLNTGNNGMSHVSTVRFAPGNDVSGPVDNVSMVRTPANISGAGAVRHGAETRPQNAYVNYIIKAT
jgi:microcystin-dependent protein